VDLSPAPAANAAILCGVGSAVPCDLRAKGFGDGESSQLTGTGYGNTGFDACLWIDIAGVEFQGRAKDLREERVALVAAFYANQIATLIPGAVIEAAIERPGMAESGSLHTMCLVRHPSGRIVVSAGYVLTTRSDPESLSRERVKVNVISSNDHGNARREMRVADALTPAGS
jgi:hypothetical protein